MTSTRTVTESNTETVTQTTTAAASVALQQPHEQRGVSWAAGTVDNEHMNRKSSKCCCIYQKPRTLTESSSESSSGSDSDANPYERMKKKKKKPHSHSHDGNSSPQKPPTKISNPTNPASTKS